MFKLYFEKEQNVLCSAGILMRIKKVNGLRDRHYGHEVNWSKELLFAPYLMGNFDRKTFTPLYKYN
jgi:hypothetical protein